MGIEINIWILDSRGLCLVHKSFTGSDLDANLITGMLSALHQFLLSQFNQSIESIDMGGYRWAYLYEKELNLIFVISDTKAVSSEILRSRLNIIKQAFISEYIPDVEKWNENWKIITQTEIMIGNLDYQPLKWKCEHCGRWNYLLTFMDPSESIVVCEYCNHDDQL